MSVIQPDGSSKDANIHLPSSWHFGLLRRTSIVVAIVLLCGVTGAVLARHGTTKTSPTASQSFYSNLDGMQLLDQEGRAFRPTELVGKTVLVNFVFTGCSTTCPTQTRELAALQQALPATLRHEVHFVSISVDPLGDTPALLRAYGKGVGADFSTWTFATGRPQEIDRLSEQLRLFRSGKFPIQPQDHAAGLWLVDAQGRLMQRYNGASVDVTRLTDEIVRLQTLSAASS